MTTDQTDAQLLELYVNGEKAAGNELAGRYVDFVYQASRRQLGDSHLAEDVTQAVFLLFLRRAKSIHASGLAGWFYKSVRYTCANARRMRTRRAYHEHRAAGVARQIDVEHADEGILAQLDAGLWSLRSDDREVLLMHYLQGRKAPEVSAAFGITDVAARKRIARAVERLRMALAEHRVTSVGAAAILETAASQKAPPGLHASVAAGKAGPAAMALYRWVAVTPLAKMATVSAASLILAIGAVVVGVGFRARYATAQTTQPAPATQPAVATSQLSDQTAEVISDSTNMKYVGAALYEYMSLHDDVMPDSLGAVLDFARSPRKTSSDRIKLFFAAHDLKKIKIPAIPTPEWIDNNTSWVFLAGGAKLSKIPRENNDWLILMHGDLNCTYTIVAPNKEPVQVVPLLFPDGHIQSVSKAEAQWDIDRSKEFFDSLRKAK